MFLNPNNFGRESLSACQVPAYVGGDRQSAPRRAGVEVAVRPGPCVASDGGASPDLATRPQGTPVSVPTGGRFLQATGLIRKSHALGYRQGDPGVTGRVVRGERAGDRSRSFVAEKDGLASYFRAVKARGTAAEESSQEIPAAPRWKSADPEDACRCGDLGCVCGIQPEPGEPRIDRRKGRARIEDETDSPFNPWTHGRRVVIRPDRGGAA